MFLIPTNERSQKPIMSHRFITSEPDCKLVTRGVDGWNSAITTPMTSQVIIHCTIVYLQLHESRAWCISSK